MRGREGFGERAERSDSVARDGGTPSGGCQEEALLTRWPRPGPPEPRGRLGSAVPAWDTPDVP